MANQDNKTRNMMIAGGLCALIISCVLVLTFEDDKSAEKEVVNEFNSSLPTAVVEDVTDDKIEARSREQRRLDNEYDYSEGSSFDLLSYEEEEKPEIDAEQIVQDMQSINEENERMLKDKQREYELQKKLYEDDLRGSKKGGGGKSRRTILSGDELEAKLRGEVEEEMKKRYGKAEELQPVPEEEKKIALAKKPETKSGFTNPLARKTTKAHDIRAVVHGEHKNLTTNSKVKLRLIDPMTIDGVTIPADKFIYSTVSFSEGRIQLTVDNINYENQILPFKGEIYDHDGSRGLSVPDNAISEAGKETADGSINSANTSIPSASSRFGSAGVSLVQNVVNGTKNAVSKQNRAIKVNISPDYKVTIREKK